jgi:hypothetical protein
VRDVLTAPGGSWPAVAAPTRVRVTLTPGAAIQIGMKGVQLGARAPSGADTPVSSVLAPGVRVDFAAAAVGEGLRRADVDAAVRAGAPAVDACWREARTRVAAGAVVLSFVADARGAIASATARSTVADRVLETCIASAARTSVLPAPVGVGRVEGSYRFELSAP